MFKPPAPTCHCLRFQRCRKCQRYIREVRAVSAAVAAKLNRAADDRPDAAVITGRELRRYGEPSMKAIRWVLRHYPTGLMRWLNYTPRTAPWIEGSNVHLGI